MNKVALTVLFFLSTSAVADVLIPRSTSYDKGRYYLIHAERKGKIIKSISKRIGVDSVGYTITKTNCNTMKMKGLGYSEISVDDIKENESKWFDLVSGSSKSDLANFVCAKYVKDGTYDESK